MRYYEFITESQVLTERGSSVLFHYTSIPAAKKILSSGNFELASVVGNRSEEKYAPQGYPYFLSLTRTVTGDYHRWVGTGAVLFKLDGDWFNSRYIVNPIDYWERSWLHSDGTRTREAEDRVFSKEATIPNNAITEVHVLLKEQHEFRSPETRQLMILAKQQTLPVYLYTDEQAWRLLDRRRATSPSAASSVLRGAPAHGGSSRKPTDYVKPWIELIEKNKREQLSDRAQRLLKNIMYYSRDDEDNNMGVDLSNARKPNAGDRASAVELIGYLQKNGYGNNTVKLKNDLVAKWNPIWAAAEKTTQGVAEGSEQTPDQVRQTLNAWMNKDQQFKDPTQRAPFQAQVWPYIQQNIKTIFADKGADGKGSYPAAPYAAWLLVQHMDATPNNQSKFASQLEQAGLDPTDGKNGEGKLQFIKDRAAVNQEILKLNDPKKYLDKHGKPLTNPTADVRDPNKFDDAGIEYTSAAAALDGAIAAGNTLLVDAVKKAQATTQPSYKQSANENFADGKNPGRKGLAKRSGVNTKASVSTLRNVAKHSSGEKQRMAHWLANMKAGRAKARKK